MGKTAFIKPSGKEGVHVQVHLVNPSNVSFGIGVITPRWLYVLAAATPLSFGDPILVDETLEQMIPTDIQPGDVVGVGVHTGNALRGYEIGKIARDRGATVIYGGIHATLFPDEPFEHGGAHAVVKGDGDMAWGQALEDHKNGVLERVYDGGKIEASTFLAARWDLMKSEDYMWASVQTVRGCPKHCSFCSVWRTDGQRPRQRNVDAVVEEVVELRRKGFRFIALADDNFYPVTLEDIRLAEHQEIETRKKTGDLSIVGSGGGNGDGGRLAELKAIRAERFELMERLAKLPDGMVFFTQITMEVTEDPSFLQAMHKARIKGALVGVEAVTEEGLKSVYKDFNVAGDELVQTLKIFMDNGVHVLGSFIFGLSSDTPETFDATAALAQEAGLAFAQFVMLTPFPGTVDFDKWEKKMESDSTRIAGFPLTRHWLIPHHLRPKMFTPHPLMSATEIRNRTQGVWDKFYSLRSIWRRSAVTPSIRARLIFLLISKLYRRMYADTGIATDSARVSRSTYWARMLAKPCRRLFQTSPMPELQIPPAG